MALSPHRLWGSERKLDFQQPPLTFFLRMILPTLSFLQLLAMDVSARATMKDAAKCDKLCEWQNSANQQNAERILHFQATPESTSGSGRLKFSATSFVCYTNNASALGCVTDGNPVTHEIYLGTFRLPILGEFFFQLWAVDQPSYASTRMISDEATR